MKHIPLLLILAALGMLSAGCQKKTANKSTSVNPLCSGPAAYYTVGCPGYVGGTTTGGTTGGTTGSNCYVGNNYYTYPGCPGFCQYNPTHTSCGGGTTNPYPQVPSNQWPHWGTKYPPTNTPPQGSCSPTYNPSGISFTPYDTRKATMTIVGGSWYNPSSPEAPNYMNTSSILKSVTQAKTFFSTDSMLKVRFKVRPEIDASGTTQSCYNRIPQSSIPGYTKLNFSVRLVGERANGIIGEEPLGFFQDVGVNSCTPGIDLSSYVGMYPNGVYIIVENVRENKQCSDIDYWNVGWSSCNSYMNVRGSECWSLDIEVAADGTKTFD